MNTMKKMFAVLLAILTLASLAACSSKKAAASSSAQIANPFVTCETMQDAAKLAGFEMTVPESVEGYPDRTIQAVKGSMIQVFFKSGDQELLLRKAAGKDDVSGDYNKYDETNTLSVGSLSVTVKGNSGTVSVATWTSGDCAYAIDVTGTGVSQDLITSLVQSIQ
jgi:hypothetical protein